jgi:hypothetical protein
MIMPGCCFNLLISSAALVLRTLAPFLPWSGVEPLREDNFGRRVQFIGNDLNVCCRGWPEVCKHAVRHYSEQYSVDGVNETQQMLI